MFPFLQIVESLKPTLRRPGDGCDSFTLSYTSATNFPLSPPPIMAKGFGWPSWGLGIRGINSKMTQWLLEQIRGGWAVKACLPMDFYRETGEAEDNLAALLVAMNFIS